jgi:putative radical SAM enzyme (TIGR03279 family)
MRYNGINNREEKFALFEVSRVVEDGAAQRFGIQKGDRIVSINGEKLIDYIDYVYFCAEEKLKFVILRDGAERTVRIKKRSDEDLGLDFTKPLLGDKRVCGNKCVFCFVDQLPKGMRKSLYVKDEDWRYSFVMGNYVTLATIKESEVKRIIKRKVSPIFVSVHTVDEDLRRKMLGNERAMGIKPMLRRFARAGISCCKPSIFCDRCIRIVCRWQWCLSG